jgi:hypothetical protein
LKFEMQGFLLSVNTGFTLQESSPSTNGGFVGFHVTYTLSLLRRVHYRA